MLKKFSNYLILLFLAFVSLTSVWSNEQSLNFSEERSFFNSSSTDEISFIPLHTIEDSNEIVVAEKEIEEELKNKNQILLKDFNLFKIQLRSVSCIEYNSPDSYFSNHLYDLFCSWKSFIL